MTQYSDFWLDPYHSTLLKRTTRSSLDIKANIEFILALVSYKKAVSNFVNIVAGQDIKVTFTSLKKSFASKDKTVVISSKIEEGDIDVTVGLALHEGMHLAVTPFDLYKHNTMSSFSLKRIFEIYSNDGVTVRTQGLYDYTLKLLSNLGFDTHVISNSTILKSDTSSRHMLTNMLEDFRIDSIAYEKYPGYRGYYKKLHNYYNQKLHVRNMYQRLKNAPIDFDTYLTVLSCKAHDPKCPSKLLPYVDEIYKLLDIKTFSSIHPHEVCVLVNILDTLINCIINFKNQFNPIVNSNTGTPSNDSDNDSDNVVKTNSNNDNSNQNNEDINDDHDENETELNFEDTENSDTEEDPSNDNSSSDADSGNDENEDIGAASAEELINFLKNIDNKPNDILNINKITKKILDHDLYSKSLLNRDVAKLVGQLSSDYSSVETSEFLSRKYRTLLVKYISMADILTSIEYVKSTGSEAVNTDLSSLIVNPDRNTRSLSDNDINICKRNGKILASRLKLRDEINKQISARKESGYIHKRSLYRIPLGNTDIFYNTKTSVYNDSHIHLTLDTSGSMGDEHKLKETLMLAVTIATACSTMQKLECTISCRTQMYSIPALCVIYDSKLDNINVLYKKIKYITCRSNTPEGLLYYQLKEYLRKRVVNKDLYIINISDGQPQCNVDDINGTELYYEGESAFKHTKEYWSKLLRETNAVGLSYYIENSIYKREKYESKFKFMYGMDAKSIDVNSISQISNTINELLMKNKTTF